MMNKKSWHLNRRTFLRSAGACFALPWLEAMANDTSAIPKQRFFGGYFAYGVPMPEDDAPDRMKNGWFPIGTGTDYKAPMMHDCIMPMREKITFLSGLSHPSVRQTSAHKGADSFLTGADILNTYDKQSISIDQHIAKNLGQDTRYKSLVTSSFGGVNRPYRTSTLSFDRAGRPIPSLKSPAEIFRRLFGAVTKSELDSIATRGSLLDEIFKDAKDLNRLLGSADRDKMEEYLTSVREVELLTKRAVEWQDTPKPNVDQSKLDLEIDETSPREYLTVMYELIALALQTDSTRVVTFQTACEQPSIADQFPSAIGIKKGAHGLSHGKKEFDDEARYIGFLNEMHANFIQRLDSIQEGESTLLDNTLSFYGCATSKTHRPVNYPIILSGGKNLGFRHGSHLNFDEERVPLANLFVTIANQLGTPTKKFADSTQDITEVLV